MAKDQGAKMIRSFDHEVRVRLSEAGLVRPEAEFSLNNTSEFPWVRLEPLFFICYPGLIRLEPCPDPGIDNRKVIYHYDHPPCRVYDYSSPIAEVHRCVLEGKRHVFNVSCDTVSVVPVVYSTCTAWKKHPPSKRRWMKSWQRAPDVVKLNHAPLKGKLHLPWWAFHPDRNCTDYLGTVVIEQSVHVFAQRGTRTEDALKAFSRDWSSKVMNAFRPVPAAW